MEKVNGFKIGHRKNLTYYFHEGVEPSDKQVQNRVHLNPNPKIRGKFDLFQIKSPAFEPTLNINPEKRIFT